MQPSSFNDSFKSFPYRKDYTDGRSNNGEIDLTQEPWRISEITEATNFPALRKLLENFNRPEAPFITLGCEAGIDQTAFRGYVEFTFKNEALANNLGFISKLDDELYAWAHNKSTELGKALQATLIWEYAAFSFHGNSERHKVVVFFQAPDKEYADHLLDTINTYFCEHLQLPA